ncbi:hypothetical protein C9374_004732 [Naegleria lovaniensis]|uniref:Uncharacterized protein n=1 Tax=Naegleria lovaniensis TaxID=51637 RepID=A0AA88GM44_NAELO|nr:uncharacterized protein C9374_004732 [Naegleria lovaniensis]KAG2382765.1 hypothetical protein C9374_004732 [Naegleria lovaniensis]
METFIISYEVSSRGKFFSNFRAILNDTLTRSFQSDTTKHYHIKSYYVMKSAPLTIHKFFVHLIYAFTLSTATWCVIVAFAIFATTRQFKWLEEDITKKVDQSLDNIASFNSNYSEDSKAQFDSTTNSSIHAMALLSSTPTARELQTKSMTISIPSQANSPKQRNVLKTSKDSEIQYITTLYISWAIYFTGTICLNFTILISIWRYLGHYFNNSQLQVIPKKETKRRQKYVIVKMTLLLLPYILCGIFELAYWCYSAASTVLDKDDEGFILVFYNFFFNTIVPLKGFFFGVAFLFGAPKIRSFFSYLCCCCCHQVKRGRYDSGISTNYAHPQLNTQTLLTEQEQEEAISTTNDYPSQSPQIGTSSHYYYLNDSSRRVENDKRQNGWKEDEINYDEIAFGRLDSRAESVIIHNPMSGSMNHVRMRQKTWHAQSSLSNVNSPNTSPTPQQQTQNDDRVVDQVENLENHQ